MFHDMSADALFATFKKPYFWEKIVLLIIGCNDETTASTKISQIGLMLSHRLTRQSNDKPPLIC